MDPRARLLVAQLGEFCRELAKRCDQLLGESVQLDRDDFMPKGRHQTRDAEKAARGATRGRQTCSLCGAVGFTKRTCGVTHNLDDKIIRLR